MSIDRSSRVLCLRWLVGVTGVLGLILGLQADVTRTQVIELQAGWNAVYLEVDPLDPAPAVVFAGLPVETVATYWPRITPVESVSSPSDAAWKQEGWGVWYAPHRPEAAISTLHAISGQRAYLVRASRDAAWELTGRVELRRLRWQADSFNLMGLSVDPAAPPTLADYFRGSPAHRELRCLRLLDGVWTLVRNPESMAIRSGEAYWIFCRGVSDYQGPLEVRAQGRGGLDFGVMTGGLGLRVASQTASTATLTVLGDVRDSRPTLPLACRVPLPSSPFASWVLISGPVLIPGLTPGDPADVLLQVNRPALESASHRALLCISEPAGSRVWIPVHAERHEP